ELLRVGREVATGLAAAHERGLIHRDIKPGNLWLESPTSRVRILDFGLARAIAEEGILTRTGELVGTPGYMAPEQVRGGSVDHRCDLFSLGCVLYRLAAGRLPFKGDSPAAVVEAVKRCDPRPLREVRPGLPGSLCNLIMGLLSKDRQDRPATARGVAAKLTALTRALRFG